MQECENRLRTVESGLPRGEKDISAVLGKAVESSTKFQTETERLKKARLEMSEELEKLQTENARLYHTLEMHEKEDPSGLLLGLRKAQERCDELRFELKKAQRVSEECRREALLAQQLVDGKNDRFEDLERQLSALESEVEKEREDHSLAVIELEREILRMRKETSPSSKDVPLLDTENPQLVASSAGGVDPTESPQQEVKRLRVELEKRNFELAAVRQQMDLSKSMQHALLKHGEGLREAESVQLSSAARMTMETLHELIQKKEEALEKYESMLEDSRRDQIAQKQAHEEEIRELMMRFREEQEDSFRKLREVLRLHSHQAQPARPDAEEAKSKELYAQLRLREEEVLGLKERLMMSQGDISRLQHKVERLDAELQNVHHQRLPASEVTCRSPKVYHACHWLWDSALPACLIHRHFVGLHRGHHAATCENTSRN